jgi:hypothetical protein
MLSWQFQSFESNNVAPKSLPQASTSSCFKLHKVHSVDTHAIHRYRPYAVLFPLHIQLLALPWQLWSSSFGPHRWLKVKRAGWGRPWRDLLMLLLLC